MPFDPAAAARGLAGQIQGGFGAQRASGGTGGPFAGMQNNPMVQKLEGVGREAAGRIMGSPGMQRFEASPVGQAMGKVIPGMIPGGGAAPAPGTAMPMVPRPAVAPVMPAAPGAVAPGGFRT
jgi:hypothetical protein